MSRELRRCDCGGEPRRHAYRCAEDAMAAFVECPTCGAQTEQFEDAFAPCGDAFDAWNAGRVQARRADHA